MTSPRLRSIQALRALAALAVVFYHACQWADCGFAIGAAGVDIFFVISGFVLWTAVRERPSTPFQFIQRRFWRVAPAYWLVTAMVAIVALVWPKLLPRVYVTPGHALLSVLFIQHNDPAGLPFPLLPVGWSLNYEAVFYAVVALSLTAPIRHRFGRIAWSLVGVMVSGMVVHPLYFLFANPMMMQFLAGAALARARLMGRLPRHGAGWGLLAVGLLLFFGLSFFDLYASLWRPLLWGAPALALVAGAVSLESQPRPNPALNRLADSPIGRIVDRLGEASYSIYLCHWPVVVALANSWGVRQSWLFVPLAAGASIGAGLVCWRLVERPLMRGEVWRRRAETGPAPAIADA